MFGLKFHHIGIACQDVDRTAEFVKSNFVITSDTGSVFDERQSATVRLFNEGEPGAIELIAGAPVTKILERRSTYYHMCYCTPNIDETLRQAKASGALPVSEPKPAVLFGMRRIAFVYTPLGLVEFLEDGCGRCC